MPGARVPPGPGRPRSFSRPPSALPMAVGGPPEAPLGGPWRRLDKVRGPPIRGEKGGPGGGGPGGRKRSGPATPRGPRTVVGTVAALLQQAAGGGLMACGGRGGSRRGGAAGAGGAGLRCGDGGGGGGGGGCSEHDVPDGGEANDEYACGARGHGTKLPMHNEDLT